MGWKIYLKNRKTLGKNHIDFKNFHDLFKIIISFPFLKVTHSNVPDIFRLENM